VDAELVSLNSGKDEELGFDIWLSEIDQKVLTDYKFKDAETSRDETINKVVMRQ
jgi:5-methylcytosine-specific restriction endonuclease McrBC regulatory subunit McrC